MASQIRFIKGVLYNLKKEYGFDCIFKRLIQTQKDYVSGSVANVVLVVPIRRVIRLPNETSRLNSLDMLFGKYSSGAKVQKNTRLFILDAQPNYTPKIDDTITLGTLVYSITHIEELDLKLGYLITGLQND